MTFERWLLIARLRLRSLLRPSAVDAELNDEIRDHLDRKTDELIASGLSPAAARVAARRSFGGVEQRAEECRDMRRIGWIEDAAHDLRYAIRMMRRSPALTLVAVLSLAVGIGANTALFSVFDVLLLRPLPVERPEELRVPSPEVRLGPKVAKSGSINSFEWLQPIYINRDVFSDVLAFAYLERASVHTAGRQLSATDGVFVTGNYFSMLGVTPQRGRPFSTPLDGQTPEISVVVISDRMWRRDFDADPSIVGTTLTINEAPFTIIGVTPPEFFGLTLGRVADLYMPLDAIAVAQPGIVTLLERRFWMVTAVGRLKPGVTEAAASAQLTNLTKAAMPKVAGPQPTYVVQVLPIETGLSGLRLRFMRPFSILMAMVGALLLIGCANVATLLLSRASARKTEIAVRTTLGARRMRLVRQLATESVLLASLAGVLGVVVTVWAGDALVRLLPSTSAAIDLNVDLNVRVLAFALTVSFAAALLSGLIPALHAVKPDVGSALRERSARTAATGRLSACFVVAEVALCVTLLIGAGLLVRTLYGLATVDIGFAPRGLVLADVNPEARGYDLKRAAVYYQDLVDRLRATPGVTSVSLSQIGFLGTGRTTGTVNVPGFTPATDEDRWVQVYQAGASFFSTLGMTILDGRDFTDDDLLHAERVAAINETAARRYFAGVSPIGRTLSTDKNEFRIVAVVHDARYNTLRDETIAALFVPYSTVRPRSRMTFAVRTAGTDANLPLVISAIQSVDRLVPIQLTTLESLVARSLGQERLLAMIATLFAASAVLLVALGVYGVMAFWVAERTPEMGIRLALGAARTQVIWTVLQRPLKLLVLGSVLGLLISVAASRFLESLLFGLSPNDPLTIVIGLLLMLIVGVTAGWLPARRASRVDPMTALRCE